MSEQSATPSTPAALPVQGAPVGDYVQKRYVSTADLAAGLDDADFDAPANGDSQELLDLANGKAPPKKAKRAPEPEPEEDDEGEGLATLDAEPTDDADDSDEIEAADPFKGKGTRDKPLTVNDLPADKFVQVKIDGKNELVDLKDLAGGYIRTQTFDRLTSKVKAAEAEALQIASGAVEEQRQFRANITAWFGDPDAVFERMDEFHPKTLEAIARKFAERYHADQQNPQLRQQREYQREIQRREAALAEERTKREQLERTHQQQQQAAQIQAALKPGYLAGIKEAGLVGVKVSDEFRETLGVLVERAKRAGQIDADTMRQLVVRAAKLAPQEPASARPAPAPIPAPKTPKPPTRNGKKDWSNVPMAQRMKDPAFWG